MPSAPAAGRVPYVSGKTLLMTLSQSAGSPEAPQACVGLSDAWRHLPSHLRLWVVAVLGLAADLWSKHWAFTSLDPDPERSWVIIRHVMRFQRSLNTGALFGLGKGMTPVFIAASVLALGFVLFLFRHSTRDRRSLHVGLGLVLAGALGNLYDRTFMQADVVRYDAGAVQHTIVGRIVSGPDERGLLIGHWPEGSQPRFIPAARNPQIRRQGVVRDFIKMEPSIPIGSWRIDIWPWVFNIADALLVVGVGLLMLNFWWDRRAEKAAGPPDACGASVG